MLVLGLEETTDAKHEEVKKDRKEVKFLSIWRLEGDIFGQKCFDQHVKEVMKQVKEPLAGRVANGFSVLRLRLASSRRETRPSHFSVAWSLFCRL